jgi:hypothetical protein
MHTGGGEGGRGGIKVYPPSKIFAKLVSGNAIKHQKVVPSQKNFTTLLYPPSQNLAKTSWTLPKDFQTVCIYVQNQIKSVLIKKHCSFLD